jgi:hypothetical protein
MDTRLQQRKVAVEAISNLVHIKSTLLRTAIAVMCRCNFKISIPYSVTLNGICCVSMPWTTPP